MLLMSLAYTQATGDKESILETYYELMVKWADYLVNNTLIPGFQYVINNKRREKMKQNKKREENEENKMKKLKRI